jgi:tetratricopeptide (TPR) repeat protein
MRRFRSISRAALVGVAAGTVVLLASPSPTFAQWHRDYENGKRALEEHRAAEAQQLFEKALREGPSPGPRVRYFGMRYDEFYPNYYLGKACALQGDRECAVRFLQESSRVDNINDRSLIDDRERLLSDLSRVDLAPELAPVREMLAAGRVGAAQSEIDSVKSANPNQAGSAEITQLEREITERRSQAERAIRDAEAALDQGAPDRAESLLAPVENVDIVASDVRRLRERIGQAKAEADVQNEEAVRLAVEEVENHLQSGRIVEANGALDSLRSIDPDGSETSRLSAYLERARDANDAFRQRRYEAAGSLFEQLSLRYPGNGWARRMASAARTRAAEMAAFESEEETGPEVDPPEGGTPPVTPDDIDIGSEPTTDVARDPVERARALLTNGSVTLAWEVVQEGSGGAERNALLEEIRQAAYATARRGVRSIFAGAENRLQAVELLDEARGPLADRAMYHLYVALAYHYLYLYEQTSEYLTHAEESIRNALEIDPNIQADPALFHPDLRKLIEESRQGS